MSYFEVKVHKLPKFGKHENADKLSIVSIDHSPVIFGTEHFKEGDLVAHIPIDAMVPVSHPEFKFMDDGKGNAKARVRKINLRGKPSNGFLIPAPPGSKEGDNVADLLGITKYEEPVSLTSGGEMESDPGFAPKYDIENLNKYDLVMIAGEPVVVTEKIHGCNAMFLWRNDRLWVRTHNNYLRDILECKHVQTVLKVKVDESRTATETFPFIPAGSEARPCTAIYEAWRSQCPECKVPRKVSFWWKVAKDYDLAEKLKMMENLAVFGEVFGQVQDLKYGAQKGQTFFRAFDVFDTANGRYLDHDDAVKTTKSVGIEWVPVLYDGPYDEAAVRALADGKSTLADNIREGVVVKPRTERYHGDLGRIILKVISNNYKFRKGGTEFH